jgi:hypothetical protein
MRKQFKDVYSGGMQILVISVVIRIILSIYKLFYQHYNQHNTNYFVRSC